jgi:hypothetical protein
VLSNRARDNWGLYAFDPNEGELGRLRKLRDPGRLEVQLGPTSSGSLPTLGRLHDVRQNLSERGDVLADARVF